MELTQAQVDWLIDFQGRMADAESAYHYWQNAEDRRRANQKAEEEDTLSHDSTAKRNRHSDAMRYLTEWVQAHPYPAADQTVPTQAQTVADSLNEANRLARLADEKQQYRNGWDGAMEAVEDVQGRQEDAREWAKRVQYNTYKEFMRSNPTDEYMRGTSAALTHFLQTGQTDRRAP